MIYYEGNLRISLFASIQSKVMQHRAFVRFLTRNDDMHETFKNLVEKNESI